MFIIEDYQTFLNQVNENKQSSIEQQQQQHQQSTAMSVSYGTSHQSTKRDAQLFNNQSTKRPYQPTIGDTNTDDEENTAASSHLDNNNTIYKQRHQKKLIKHSAWMILFFIAEFFVL